MGSLWDRRIVLRSGGGALIGEIIRRTKNGKFIGFYLRFYEGGKRRVLASKQATHADAKRMLVEIEARIARGEMGIPERRTTWPKIAELIEQFLREYSRPKLKDIDKYRAQARSVLARALPYLGKLSAAEVESEDVAKMRDALGRRFAAGTVYNILATLSAVFSWAMRQELAPRNPCKGVERPSAAQSLDFLTREEVQRLLEAAAARANTLAGRMLHAGIAIAVHTGIRKGELLGLRWIDLDFETRRLTIARSYRGTPKSGRSRQLRLPSALIPILTAWREHCPQSPDGSVLPIGHNLTKVGGKESMLGLPQLMTELGMRLVLHPWHMLRHTFASHFVMAGGNILALQRILGHSDVKMTMVYAHLAPDFLGDEMERVKF